MKMSFSQEGSIIALGLHSFKDFVGGSKLTEHTLPNVVQLEISLHLTPMHMSLFSDRLILFRTYQFKEIRHFETTE